MSTTLHTTPQPCRTFGEYMSALIARLNELEPALVRRLREVVGERRARLVLDKEAIEIRFAEGNLVVTEASDGVVDGEGATDRETTLHILAGRLEVTTALLEGRIRATGEIENLVRIFQAIEILLDGACRNPSLQKLSLDYTSDPCRESLAPGSRFTAARRVFLDPDQLPAGERAMLGRLGLLP